MKCKPPSTKKPAAVWGQTPSGCTYIASTKLTMKQLQKAADILTRALARHQDPSNGHLESQKKTPR